MNHGLEDIVVMETGLEAVQRSTRIDADTQCKRALKQRQIYEETM